MMISSASASVSRRSREFFTRLPLRRQRTAPSMVSPPSHFMSSSVSSSFHIGKRRFHCAAALRSVASDGGGSSRLGKLEDSVYPSRHPPDDRAPLTSANDAITDKVGASRSLQSDGALGLEFVSECPTVREARGAGPSDHEDEMHRILGIPTHASTHPTHCPGCGAKLQSTDPLAIGFQPPPSKSSMAMGSIARARSVCQRCHALCFANGKSTAIAIPFESISHHMKQLTGVHALVVKVVDLVDFQGSFLRKFRRDIAGRNNPILIVANKLDLLPRGTNPQRVASWVMKESRRMGLKGLNGVQVVSAKTGEGFRELNRRIEKMRKGKDVYIVGCTNVGKSTVINRLRKAARAPGRDGPSPITTSFIPGTTLNLLSFPIGRRAKKKAKGNDPALRERQGWLYDTPGLINEGNLATMLEREDLLQIYPRERLKPRVYRLTPGKTLLLGGLARIDYVEGNGPMRFAVYASNRLHIHPTSMDKADDVRSAGLGVPPFTPPSYPRPLDGEHGASIPPQDGPISSLIPCELRPAGPGGWHGGLGEVALGALGWIGLSASKGNPHPVISVHLPRNAAPARCRPALLRAETRKDVRVVKHGRVNRKRGTRQDNATDGAQGQTTIREQDDGDGEDDEEDDEEEYGGDDGDTLCSDISWRF